MATVAKSSRSTTITLASATAGPFDLDFRLFDTDTLDVFVNYLPRTDWTLNATFVDGYTDSAAITFDAALAPGDVIVVNGELFPHRSQDYLNSGGLVDKLNIELPRLWAAISEQYRNNRRSLRFFQSVSPVELEANKAIIANATGDGLEMGPTIDEISAAQGYAEQAGDAADRAEAVGLFGDRSELVLWLVENTPVEGRLYYAGGLFFEGRVGATDIDDLPGLVPHGDIYAEHFGLNADLEFTTDANGYTRTAGTADNAAFEAADAYALSSGKGVFYCNSDVFLDGQIDLSARVHWVTGFRNYCWFRMAETETGFSITDPNGGVSGVLGIVQHNTTTKQPNRGQHGNFVTVGDFMATAAQTHVTDVVIDVRVCRAADVTGQDSYPSPSINANGYVSHCNFKIGTFGTTNAPGSIFFQAHWGGYNGTGDPTLQPTETYHPNNIDVEIVGPVTGHTRGVTLSSVYNVRISDFTTDGVKYPLTHLVGDNVNDYAIADQAAYVGQNVHIGFVRALDCEIDTGDTDDAVLITSRGTSKFAVFSGTAVPLLKQIPIEVTCDGFDIELTGTNTASTAVRVFGALGSVDLGEVYTTGETKASVEIEFGNAEVKVDVRKADMDVLYEEATGGSILGSAVDKSSSYDGTGDYCVQVVGSEVTTTTTADATEGDTTIQITAFGSDEVHVGDRILIGDQPVIATAFIDSTVPFLTTTPIQKTVSSGATVTLDRTARLKRLVGNFTGSEYGSNIDRAVIDSADYSDAQWTGRNAARLSNGSVVRLNGDVPVSTSRLTTASDYTFVVGVGCSVHLSPGVKVPYNADLQAHFQLGRTGASGPWGILVAHGAIIEDVSNLVSATEPFRQARLYNCHDFDGSYIDHPNGKGSDANGHWVKHADGTMECWARNFTLGVSQPETWTFPGGGFIETASIGVFVTPASATSPRMGHGVANSATTAEIWAHNDDGTDAPSTGVNLYAKGYWR